MASIVASKVAIGCLAIALILCLWCAFSTVDELVKNADEWEEGE